jgi:replicative DNA helicase
MTDTLERPLPHSAEAERVVLGSIFLDNSLAARVGEFLRPEDFYVRAHQFVFAAMVGLSGRGGEIGPILVGEELRRDGLLEQVGGVSFVSDLTTGLHIVASIEPYAKVVKDKSLMRQAIKAGNKITSEALEEEDEAQVIIDRMGDYHSALKEEVSRSGMGVRRTILTSFAEFMAADFEDGEEIAFHARRGEVVLVQSVTNHGKSTLIRNSAIALATGREFPPVSAGGSPRRVHLLNLEGSADWFRSDLRAMTRHLGAATDLLLANLFPTHAPVLDGEPLSLSRHMRALERDARLESGVDVLIVDTASAAFSLRNENDNSEVANHVMKPLVRLARRLSCLIVLVHHVGKAKAEEGAAREQAHRGRGASAWGDFSTSIFNLDADPHEQERVTLTCAKRKDGPNYERVLRLDRARRWFEATDEAPVRSVTNDDIVLEAMESVGEREMQTAEILSAVGGRVKQRTLMDCLKRLADAGKIESLRRGFWALTKVCATCAAPYKGLHICTSAAGDGQTLTGFDLPAVAAEVGAPANGNGLHKLRP